MTHSYLLTTADAERWRAALPTGACVMGSLEYARILERHAGYAGRLFVVETDGGRMAYPFFLRPIEVDPPAAGFGQQHWDTITPEYTGPLRLGPGPLSQASGTSLPDLFANHCRENGIVAEFAHLNPWRSAVEFLDPGCVEANREIIYLDLTWGEERLWSKSLSSDARRHARQAAKAQIRYRRASTRQDVLAFHHLYAATMDRRAALERYYFSPEYFLSFFDGMSDNAFFVLAEYEGRTIAGGLYLHDDRDVYWHLSAADLEYSRVRPVNGYHWDTIQWAVREGKRYLLCGGGYAPDDGVFRFKSHFSPLRAQFNVYKRIHDPGRYAALTRAWSERHGGRPAQGSFFPAYRAVPASNPEPAVAAPEAAGQSTSAP